MNGIPGDIMIIGVNRETIQRNILTHLYKFLGFPVPASKTNETRLYGRNVYFVGAHDESSVRRIQGSTIAYAYADECASLPLPFWRMLLSRLSLKGSQLFATCNPEGPAHWLKKDFIDRKDELDLIYWNFTLDDNPSLDQAYKDSIKKEYSGMWYARYILGEWAVSHGLVYDSFTQDNIYSHEKNNPNYYIMGIDYGTTNPTAAVIIAVSPKQWPQLSVTAEYYYDSSVKGRSKTDQELVADIKEFIAWRPISTIYIDPAAASLKLALRQVDLPVVDAKNDVLLGVKIVNKFISNLNLVIHRDCKNLLDQIQSYAWDPRAAERGEDVPIKKNDHIVDALRYACASAFPSGEFNNPDEQLTIDQLRKRVYGSDINQDFYGGNSPGQFF